MIPRILEYEDGIVKVTAEAYAIPELKAIIDNCAPSEAYLSFIYSMSAPDSPYRNIPETEKLESVLYDVQQTIGDIDYENPFVDKAIKKLRSLYSSPIVLLAEELEAEISRIREWLRTTPIVSGAEGNMTDRRAILKEIDKYAINVATVRKQADEEMKVKMKGDQEMGEY